MVAKQNIKRNKVIISWKNGCKNEWKFSSRNRNGKNNGIIFLDTKRSTSIKLNEVIHYSIRGTGGDL